ncbi:MAG: hypothetical protein EOP85_16035, partial [Verrucomicrobiaceae bacterium]
VPTTYQVRGVVKDLHPETKNAIIDHEEVPGYMEAMTMPLRVRDSALLQGLKKGDRISFRLNVTEKVDWIDEIKVLESGVPLKLAGKEEELPDLRPIAPGQLIPDATLLDVKGDELKIASYRGQATAITFIYTRCPLPTFCPRLNSHFEATAELLKKDTDGPRNWKLLSITIDPARDTPEALAEFSKAIGADPAHWSFATGSLQDITAFTLKCGLRFWDDRGLIQHNLRTLVVNPDGTVRKVLEESEWTPEELAAELRAAAIDRKN